MSKSPGYVKRKTPWKEIPLSKPAEQFMGKIGAFKWHQLDDKDNCGDIEVMCRNMFTKEERLVTLPYTCLEGFQAWLDGEMIQNALPHCSSSTRELLINGLS